MMAHVVGLIMYTWLCIFAAVAVVVLPVLGIRHWLLGKARNRAR